MSQPIGNNFNLSPINSPLNINIDAKNNESVNADHSYARINSNSKIDGDTTYVNADHSYAKIIGNSKKDGNTTPTQTTNKTISVTQLIQNSMPDSIQQKLTPHRKRDATKLPDHLSANQPLLKKQGTQESAPHSSSNPLNNPSMSPKRTVLSQLGKSINAIASYNQRILKNSEIHVSAPHSSSNSLNNSSFSPRRIVLSHSANPTKAIASTNQLLLKNPDIQVSAPHSSSNSLNISSNSLNQNQNLHTYNLPSIFWQENRNKLLTNPAIKKYIQEIETSINTKYFKIKENNTKEPLPTRWKDLEPAEKLQRLNLKMTEVLNALDPTAAKRLNVQNRFLDLSLYQEIPNEIADINLDHIKPVISKKFPETAQLSLREFRNFLNNHENFEKFKAVNDLDFSNINISRLPPEIRVFDQNLQTLVFSGSQMTAFPDNLPIKLQTLKISNIPIKTWPFLPIHLRHLDLNTTEIDDIPDTLPEHLETLSLNHNNVAFWPKYWPQPLRKLSLNNTKMDDWPEPGHWPLLLESLDLSYTPINDWAEKWPKILRELNLNNTAIYEWPKKWPKILRVLCLNNTQINEWPEKWPKNLQILTLNNTQLDGLPETLPTSLRELHLQNTPIANQPELIQQFKKKWPSINLII